MEALSGRSSMFCSCFSISANRVLIMIPTSKSARSVSARSMRQLTNETNYCGQASPAPTKGSMLMSREGNNVPKRASHDNSYNGYNGRYCTSLQSPGDYRGPISSAALQDLHLVGPTDIMWVTDINLRVSAYNLQPPQLKTSIDICVDCKSDEHMVYGHWLTRVYRELVGALHIDRKRFAINDPPTECPEHWQRVIEKHQAFLQYLGDLQELVTRCRENEYRLTGIVFGDLRNCKPLEVKKRLYKAKVPGTNYVNVYRHRFQLNVPVEQCYVELWRNQPDPQILELNEELGIL